VTIADLARRTEQDHLQQEHDLLEILDALRDIDPETAEQTIMVFGDRIKAARWLTGPVRSLGGGVPLRLLAAGKRGDVLAVLHRIRHGVYG
jgi:uncharacterized protein (DUF2384 family)